MIPTKTPVFLLKTKSTPVDGYEEYFTNLEGGTYQPTFVPVLEHRFTEGALQKIKDNITAKAFLPGPQSTRYGGLIFTSQRAVEAFTKIIGNLREDGVQVETFLPASLPIYVVGPATARALRALELPCQILGEETGNGEALAEYMLQHYNAQYSSNELASKPGLLFLVGEQRRDIIPKTLTSAADSIEVEELTVYETGVMESFSRDFSELALPYFKQNKRQWVIVFSPTGCKAMLQVLDMLDETTGKLKKDAEGLPRETHIATIGPTTRDYLKNEFGFEPDVCAATPSAEGLGEGILAFEKSMPT